METSVRLTRHPIPPDVFAAPSGSETGAEVVFWGRVRGIENGAPIRALRYEAYEPMAIREIERLIAAAGTGCQQVDVIHRLGDIPVGEASIAVRICSAHRNEALAFLGTFMDRLKKDVPVWKTRSLS